MPSDQTINALFAEQAARTPDAIAVQFGGQSVTYAELAGRSDALASELRNHGVKTETPVGIFLERSIETVVAVLGVLKSGGCYLPLDPAFPPDRLTHMVSDARPPVLVTDSNLIAGLPAHQARVIRIDQLGHVPQSFTERSHSNHSQSANLAYIIYTSGSTGRPKGVQVTHRSVVNFLQSMRREPGLGASDVLLAITTLSFDIAGLEVFLPLTTGAKVVIASRDETVDGARLVKKFASSGVTVMQATPATWRMLIDAGWQGSSRLKILCGGEAIDRGLADQLLSRCAELWNMYGPTETTIWSTTERLLPNQSISIGRPIDNTQAYILDDDAQPVPPDTTGELYIGGEGVARGYLNQPRLTADRFIPDPFSEHEEGRLYRTGDLARFRVDGRIEFVGRADQQVKIRGFRVEPSEIETVLATIDDVARAVVLLREDLPDPPRLVAYVTLKRPTLRTEYSESAGAYPSSLDTTALRAALRSRLPDYMIPAEFVVLETLPLTPNGKIDRKALPKPGTDAASHATHEPPRGPVEEKLAGIWASVLRRTNVGRTDDFFAAGGYSILAVSLFNEIERAFGQRLPLATLYRAPTVAALAAVLQDGSAVPQQWASLVPIQPGGAKPKFFCVHGAGGNVLLYRDLVRFLGPEYPFYGLQSLGLDKHSRPLTTVEAMAEHYLKEICALQPEGPYCLGGYCLGGTVAYEMARRLRASGHEVALLALFDTYNFTRMHEAPPLRYLRQKFVFHARNLASLSGGDLWGYLSSKVRVATDGELRSLWKSLSRSLHSPRTSATSHPAQIEIQEINDAAAAAYRPDKYDGHVIVFKPRVNYDFLPDPSMGWTGTVTGELDIVELPVNPHAMLVAPFAGHLADELRRRIDDVAAGSFVAGVADPGPASARPATTMPTPPSEYRGHRE